MARSVRLVSLASPLRVALPWFPQHRCSREPFLPTLCCPPQPPSPRFPPTWLRNVCMQGRVWAPSPVIVTLSLDDLTHSLSAFAAVSPQCPCPHPQLSSLLAPDTPKGLHSNSDSMGELLPRGPRGAKCLSCIILCNSHHDTMWVKRHPCSP